MLIMFCFFFPIGGSLFSDYQALMRIWTHPWSLKLETARKIENFIDSDDDSLKDFVVYSDEEEESAVSSEEMSWTSDTSSDTGKGTCISNWDHYVTLSSHISE